MRSLRCHDTVHVPSTLLCVLDENCREDGHGGSLDISLQRGRRFAILDGKLDQAGQKGFSPLVVLGLDDAQSD